MPQGEGKPRRTGAGEPQEQHLSPLTCSPVMDTRFDSTVGRRGSRGEECGDVTGE